MATSNNKFHLRERIPRSLNLEFPSQVVVDTPYYTEIIWRIEIMPRRLLKFFDWSEGHCQRQGPKWRRKIWAKPTPTETDSSDYFGITQRRRGAKTQKTPKFLCVSASLRRCVSTSIFKLREFQVEAVYIKSLYLYLSHLICFLKPGTSRNEQSEPGQGRKAASLRNLPYASSHLRCFLFGIPNFFFIGKAHFSKRAFRINPRPLSFLDQLPHTVAKIGLFRLFL